jgi:hypothetical protein
MALAYVQFGQDPTIFQQDTTTGKILKMYPTWDALLKDNPSGAISAGQKVPKKQWATDGQGGYGFKLDDGHVSILSNEGSFFQATGQNDWGTINNMMAAPASPTPAAAPAKKIEDITDKTLVKFADNPTVFEVQNGTILGKVDATPSQEVTVVERPRADSLYKSSTDPTVYGLYEGLAIPFGNEAELTNNEGADAWGKIETKTDAELFDERLIQAITLVRKQDAIDNQLPAELDMPFNEWLNTRLTITKDDGTVVTGQDALKEMVAEEWADYRKEKVDYLKNTYDLTQREAEIEYNNNKQTYEAGMEATLQDIGIEKSQLQEDLNTKLTALGLQREYTEQDLAAKREQLGADYNKQLEDYTKSGERTQEDIANKRADLLRDYTADIEQFTTQSGRVQEDTATKKAQLQQDLETQLQQYQLTGQRTAEDIARKRIELEQDLATKVEDFAITSSRLQSDIAKKKIELQQDLESQLEDYTTAETRTREDIEKKRTELEQDLQTQLDNYATQSTRLSEDTTTAQQQLESARESFMDRTMFEAKQNKEALRQDFADRGLFRGSERVKQEGVLDTRVGMNISDYLKAYQANKESIQKQQARGQEDIGKATTQVQTEAQRQQEALNIAMQRTQEDVAKQKALAQQMFGRDISTLTEAERRQLEDVSRAQAQALQEAQRQQDSLTTTGQRSQEDVARASALAQQMYGRDISTLTTEELRKLQDIMTAQAATTGAYESNTRDINLYGDRTAEDTASNISYLGGQYGRELTAAEQAAQRQGTAIGQAEQAAQTDYNRDVATADLQANRIGQEYQQLYGTEGYYPQLQANQQQQNALIYGNQQNELDQNLKVQQAEQQGLKTDEYAREYDWLREPYTSGA